MKSPSTSAPATARLFSVSPQGSSPRRIVCLTEETTEILYRLGEEDRIVGVSGYTVRPPAARTKPRVSAFVNAKFDKIVALEPDLVLAFSDLQADISRELIRRGVNVLTFNQRSVADILEMIRTLSRIVGATTKGNSLVEELQRDLTNIAESAEQFPRRPRVFFEEWKDPLISGIRWVDELIEIAGGQPIFPEFRGRQDAKRRIVSSRDVVERDPDVIIASWCGVKVNKGYIRSRPNWDKISAVCQGHIYEVKSTYILQPGPAALTEGVRQLHAILGHVVGCGISPKLLPEERLDPDLDGAESAENLG